MRRALLVALLVASSLASPSTYGSASGGDAADIAAARELATAGVLLADAGKCDEAVDKLARAEKLHHAPTILGRLGECQVDLGKLVEGTENLQRVIREPLGDKPPAAFVQAVERAKKVLLVAEPKIAKLTIHVEPESATLTIDGVAVSQAALGTSRPMDPGSHVLDARAPGYKSSLTTITLTTSQITSVTIKLEKLPEDTTQPEPPKPAEPPKKVEIAPAPKPVEPTPAPRSTLRTVSSVTFVIGGVALVAGGTFGLFAIDRKNALDRECPGKSCPEASRDTLDAANRWSTLSTIGFIVGGAGIATGAVLLFVAQSENKTASITPMIGLGSIGLRGEF